MSDADSSTTTSQLPRERERSRSSVLRQAARLGALAAAVALLWPLIVGSRWPVIVPALSPLVALAALLGGRTFLSIAWLGLAVGAIALVRRRWFCRWVCPLGTCADGATRLGRRLGCKCPRLPPVGQWLALVTLAGALAGYPLLVWLDPLAIFSGSFGLLRAAQPSGAWWPAIGMAGVLLLSAILPGVWCLRLCPLGALQDLLALPAAAFKGRGSSTSAEPPRGLPRRAVLAGALGLAWAVATRRARANVPRPLRPPGARDESSFSGLCIRCGNCLRSCPTRIIELDGGEHGWAAWLAPRVRMIDDYCREDCVRCTEVCPSGALRPLAVTEKLAAPIGLPRVDMEVCLLGDDRDCAICRNRCPFEAIALVFDETEYTLTPRIDASRCPGCGACQVACPTTPKAIVVEP